MFWVPVVLLLKRKPPLAVLLSPVVLLRAQAPQAVFWPVVCSEARYVLRV